MKSNINFASKAFKGLGLALFMTAIGLTACKKDKGVSENNATDLTIQIAQLGTKYKVTPASKGPTTLDDKHSKKSATKAAKLALADAVGGAVSSGGGIWGVLWGGFLTTLALEPSFREPEPKKTKSSIILPPSTHTQSGLFDYGMVGDGHNVLMHEAYINDLNTNVSNNHLNAAISHLLVSTPIAQFPQPPNGMQALFVTQEPLLISAVNAASTIQVSQDVWTLVNNSSISSGAKNIINSVMDAVVLNDMIEGANFTNFFNDVEEMVKTGNLSAGSKLEVKYFLAIANSSMHYWKQNFPMQ